MNKKIIFFIFFLLFIIIGILVYQKYARYLPTETSAIHVQNLTPTEINKIRQETPITEVKAYKSARHIQLLHHKQVIRDYPMRLGFEPIGHKVQEGDGKTPEGQYVLD